MHMKLRLICGAIVLASLVGLSSCDDDDSAAPVTGIEFEIEEQAITESDGELTSIHPLITIEGLEGNVGRVIPVRLSFDRPLAGDVTIKFSIQKSTASDQTTGSGDDTEYSDFEIEEQGENLVVSGDEITIRSGTEEASFSVRVFEDFLLEYDERGDFTDDGVSFERVVIVLESVVSGPAELGVKTEHSLNILEDDIITYLEWFPQEANLQDESNDVNMDMFVIFENGFGAALEDPGSEPESLLIPGGIGTGAVQFSYNYTSGSSDDLLFNVGFLSLAGTLDGESYIDAPLIFSGRYDLSDRNQYNVTGALAVSQTAEKVGIDYQNFSAINSSAAGGSRFQTMNGLSISTAEIKKNLPVQTKAKIVSARSLVNRR
jgi:hypothetical protein